MQCNTLRYKYVLYVVVIPLSISQNAHISISMSTSTSTSVLHLHFYRLNLPIRLHNMYTYIPTYGPCTYVGMYGSFIPFQLLHDWLKERKKERKKERNLISTSVQFSSVQFSFASRLLNNMQIFNNNNNSNSNNKNENPNKKCNWKDSGVQYPLLLLLLLLLPPITATGSSSNSLWQLLILWHKYTWVDHNKFLILTNICHFQFWIGVLKCVK